MKIIELTPAAQESQPGGRLDELISSLRIGRSTSPDLEAQETVIGAMKRILDNRYVLFRNITLDGLDAPVPLVLVGPAGVFMFYPSGLRGVFRAKGDVWEKLDDRQQNFKPSSPNLITLADQISQAMAGFLSSGSRQPIKVEAGVLFSDPGIHVETSRPTVRLVLVDSLDRFLAGLAQNRTRIGQEEIDRLVGLLSATAPEASTPQTIQQDAFSFVDEKIQQPKPESIPEPVKRAEKAALDQLKKVPFSSKQVIMLSALVLVNIIILIGFVVYILLNS